MKNRNENSQTLTFCKLCLIYIIDMVNKNMKYRLSKYDKIFMVMMITSIVIIGVCFLPIKY